MANNLPTNLFAKRKKFLCMHASTWLVLVLLFASFCWLDYVANECGCLKIISNFPSDEIPNSHYQIYGWHPAELFSVCMIVFAGTFMIFTVIIAESIAQQKRVRIQLSLGLFFTLISLIAIVCVILKAFGTIDY